MVNLTDQQNPEPEEDVNTSYDALVQDQTENVRASLLPRPAPYASLPEPRTTHPVTLFFCVVLPAFFGLSFYFLFRPHELSSQTRAHHLPRTIAAPTILISIDGFRHEYLTRSRNGKPLAPTLQALATEGVTARNGMQPIMPTKTFPNHWSLVTGLYAESHGIIGNTMYDPNAKQWFHHTGTDSRWYHGQPIWQTLQHTTMVLLDETNATVNANATYTTACVFWPGASVETHRPDAFWAYDSSITYEKRNQRAYDLLFGSASDLQRPAQFVTLYYEGVDHEGHTHGPNSPQVDREIQKADKAIEEFLEKLGHLYASHFNVIVVSDHGMTEISDNRTVDLSPAMPEGTVQDIRTTPLGLWLNTTVSAGKVHEQIQKELQKHDDEATVYLKENVPERWHIRNSPFLTPIVTIAKIGWTVLYPHQHLVPGAERRLPRDTVSGKGDHGFDNTEEDMRAIFIAQGPAFQSGATVDGFEAVDLYPLICHIFGATPAPHNGTLQKSLSSILKTTG